MRFISLVTTVAFLGACLCPPFLLAYVHTATQAFGYDDLNPKLMPGTGFSVTRQQRYRDFVKLAGPYDPLVDDALVEAHF